MDMRDLRYFMTGLSDTLGRVSDELYDNLVIKGKKRMGQETGAEGPQISELIRRTRGEQAVSELISRGKKGREELIKSIGAEVRRVLSSVGIVTRTDLARLEKRMNEIEEMLAEKGG